MTMGGLFLRLVDWCAVMFFVVAVSLLLACGGGGETKSAPSVHSDLAEGIVARVGQEAVTVDGVARVAKAQAIDATAARDLALRDALFASEARQSGLAQSRSVQAQVDSVLARRLLRELLADAERMGPTTDAELAEVMRRRWLELDRPEGFRTVHAVVRLAENADGALRVRAEGIAEAIRKEVAQATLEASTMKMPSPAELAAGVRDPASSAFRQAATSVAHEGLEVVVEDLAPVAADGRVLQPNGGGLEPAFAKAASQLVQRGDLSPLVVTSYGVHVIMLLERTPSLTVPVEERRKMVREEVVWSRASALRMKLVADLRRDVSVESGADALLALVSIER